MLRSEDKSRGLAVSFNTNGLPKFILWKNTASITDGYVVGLEPATNFPNPRSFEEKHGRVVELQPEQTASFRVTLQPLTNSEEVKQVSERIDHLKGEDPAVIHSKPIQDWTP